PKTTTSETELVGTGSFRKLSSQLIDINAIRTNNIIFFMLFFFKSLHSHQMKQFFGCKNGNWLYLQSFALGQCLCEFGRLINYLLVNRLLIWKLQICLLLQKVGCNQGLRLSILNSHS